MQGYPGFAGGLGWPLASLHLLTLGVLTMAAIGASLQLLPVATRQPIHWRHGPALVWWLYTPGVALVAIGMGFAQPLPLAAGAILVALALVLYAALLARNLAGARGMPVVVAHGWVAWGSLCVAVVTALSLALAAFLASTRLAQAAAAIGAAGALAFAVFFAVAQWRLAVATPALPTT